MRHIVTHFRLTWILLLVAAGYPFIAPYVYADLYHFLHPWQNLLAALPYFLTAIILLISWHFHSCKPLWVSLIISFVHFSTQTELFYQGIFTLSMLAILPLWLLILAMLAEKPLFSRQAISQLAILALPIALAISAFLFKPADYLTLLTFEPAWLQFYTPQLPYTGWLIGLQVAAASIVLFTLLRYRQQQDLYLLVTFALLGGAIYGVFKPLEMVLLFNFLLVIWLLAVLVYGHNLAYLDELTGLPGRRALNQAMNGLSKKSVVAMLDVDHFKKFNDSYGHDVGDQVLKMVASRMRNVRGGTAYRYGGEEFTILFPSTQIETARAAAEEVRIAVENSSLQLRSKHRPKSQKKGTQLRGSGPGKDTRSVSVTISIGLADNSVRDPLKVADKKLYEAKQQGRNQVCL